MTLTTGELSWMRSASDAILPGTCIIKRPTRSQSATGAWTETMGTIAASAVCRLDILSSEAERKIAESVGVVNGFVLALKYDQDIREIDQVVFESNTYEVAAVQKAQSWLIHRRCIVKKVQS